MPRSPAPKLKPRTTSRCFCVCAKHPQAETIDAELRTVGTSDAPDGLTLSSLSQRYGIDKDKLCRHRLLHLGLPPLPRGRPVIVPPPAPETLARREAQREVHRPPTLAKAEPTQLPPTSEGKFAQLVKTVATLITLGSYRGIQTVRALAARHGVSEEEVQRAHRRASLSVRDARGGLREQLELSVAVLTQIRDQERQVAEDYTGIARRLIDASLPDANGVAARPPSVEELDKARTARSIAAQAQDCAIAAQKQIDQNTIHRRTAPLVQVSFSASPDFNRAQEALVAIMCAMLGDDEGVKAKVARGLQVLEDAGENLDAPEFLEYLGELRADSSAVTVEAEAAE